MGKIPELLRQRPEAKRSTHPILSFAGIRADKSLATQTLEEPFAPIRKFAEAWRVASHAEAGYCFLETAFVHARATLHPPAFSCS